MAISSYSKIAPKLNYVLNYLKENEIKIGSSTGYSREMIEIIKN